MNIRKKVKISIETMTLKIRNVDIPIRKDEIMLKGSIYSSTSTGEKAPFIINCAGMLETRDSFFVTFFSERFAEAGYYVLSYDHRAHGETAKQTGKNWLKFVNEIFSDIHIVIEWLITHEANKLLDNKIILFGRSLGAAIILTHGFIDERAKILIALCARYNYSELQLKFSENVIKNISAKYFLKKNNLNSSRILIAHCKDDERIPFENLIKIKNHLGLNTENVIIYKTGGHSFKGHREDIAIKSLEFINKNI